MTGENVHQGAKAAGAQPPEVVPRRETTAADSVSGAAPQAADFERQASAPPMPLAVELLSFLLHNKKWWLAPIVFVLALMGLLVVLGGTPLAPLIYTIF